MCACDFVTDTDLSFDHGVSLVMIARFYTKLNLAFLFQLVCLSFGWVFVPRSVLSFSRSGVSMDASVTSNVATTPTPPLLLSFAGSICHQDQTGPKSPR